MADTIVTAQTVIDNSIARAKDPDKTQWSDAQMLRFLNKARDYVYRLLVATQSELVISSTTIPLVAGTASYTLPDDFWGVINNGVYISGVDTPLYPVTQLDFVRAVGDTTDEHPESFFLTSTQIGFLPVPTATAVGLHGTISLRYSRYSAPLALSDSMPWANILTEPMAAFMDHIAFIKSEVPTQELMAIYNALEQATMAMLTRRGAAV
jgi:hypothetical protein